MPERTGERSQPLLASSREIRVWAWFLLGVAFMAFTHDSAATVGCFVMSKLTDMEGR